MSATVATTLPPAAESAAYALAEAEAAVARTSAVLVDATERRNRISGRIAALNSERATNIARRQGGAGDDADGAKLALLAADLEGLDSLFSDAEGVVADARAPHHQAQQAVTSAGHILGTMQAEAEESALVCYLADLEQRAIEAMQRLAALHIQLGRGRPVWVPSVELQQALRRLAAAGGTL
jgi:hypothetical protein